MSEDEITAIEEQLKQFKLPVGTKGLVAELQQRLAVLRVRHESKASPIPAALAPVADWEAISAQLQQVLVAVSTTQADRATSQLLPDYYEPSLTYELINDEPVRRQLLADNMRMEASLRKVEFWPDFHEEQAFRRFCTFAAFQIEEMLNYFYFNRYEDDIPSLIEEFRQLRVEVIGYNSNVNSIKSIDKIKTYVKIKAYNLEFIGKEYSFFNTLVNIRNMEEHRCSVLLRTNHTLTTHESIALNTIRERNAVEVRAYLRSMYNRVSDYQN